MATVGVFLPLSDVMRQLTDYILIIPKAIPLDLCEEIINEYPEQEFEIASLIGSSYPGQEKDLYRRCKSIDISANTTISQNITKRLELDRRLHGEMAAKCLEAYSFLVGPYSSISRDSGYNLLRYEEGDYYRSHVDHSPDVLRTLSLSVTLNEEFEGGALSFFEGELDYFPKRGEGIMFPSHFMYDHQVKPVISGVRYALVTWFT